MENNDYDYSGFVRNIQATSTINNDGNRNNVNPNAVNYSAPQEPVFVNPEEIEKKPKDKGKAKKIITVLLVIIYTGVVSAGSILAYREYLKHEIKSSIEDLWSDSFSDDYGIGDSKDDDSDSKSEEKAKNVTLNKMFKVGNVCEVTINKSEWKEKVESRLEKDGSYYDNKNGETYFVVYGKLKNISGKEYGISELKCNLLVNDKYNVQGFVATDSKEGGLDSYNYIKPLQEVDAVFIISVSDEMYKKCSTAKMTMSFPKDEDSIGSYYDKDYVNYAVSFKN